MYHRLITHAPIPQRVFALVENLFGQLSLTYEKPFRFSSRRSKNLLSLQIISPGTYSICSIIGRWQRDNDNDNDNDDDGDGDDDDNGDDDNNNN